jgi:hypothetical protein
MPIVSSQIVRNHNRGNGSLSVHEQHTDHLGKVHEHRYHCPLDYDVDTALVDWVATLEASLIEQEKDSIFTSVSEGTDPSTITVKHIPNLQKAKQVLKALMFGEAKDVIKAAEFVSSFSDAQIENHFTETQRIRIRARQDYVLNNQAIIEADDTLREEL